MNIRLLAGCLTVMCLAANAAGRGAGEGEAMESSKPKNALYLYELASQGTPAAYDEAMAVACFQGIINRERPVLYVLSSFNGKPRYWLDIFARAPHWLAGRPHVTVDGLDALAALAGARVKGAVVWDPAVPATVNVATTIAGVKDGVVLSPELAEQCLAKWNLPVLDDLRGRFDGAETGSKKNDAYRWAVREYLEKDLCSSHLLCLFEDAATTRAAGSVGYVVTRDWAVKNRAFVFDLSPWGDETPKDDPDQPLGTDLDTYRMILGQVQKNAAGKHMTELTGFFAFWKYSNIEGYASKHEPVPTEWESVYVMSPYNCYQNTISSDCYNQSLHSQAPFKRLKQRRPERMKTVEDRAYVCILMADYDSATPLYDFLPKFWEDPNRGKIPLAWGINPNLIETYPDIITHLYATATANDHFTSDASAAGYFNPNRIEPSALPLFVKHNKRFFRDTDMSIAPMVLDWDQPTPAVKDAFTKFAPDGFATIVLDMHHTGGAVPKPHVWKGMPVLELINNTCNFSSPKQTADAMYGAINERGNKRPGFYFFRIVWTPPTAILESLDVFRNEHPDIPIEVVDPYNFFALFKKLAVLQRADLPNLYRVLEREDRANDWFDALHAICSLEEDEKALRVVVNHIRTPRREEDMRSLERWGVVRSIVVLGLLEPEVSAEFLTKALTEEGACEILKEWEDNKDFEMLVAILRSGAAEALLEFNDDRYLRPVRELYDQLKLRPQESLTRWEEWVLWGVMGVLARRDMIKDIGKEEVQRLYASVEEDVEATMQLLMPYQMPYIDELQTMRGK